MSAGVKFVCNTAIFIGETGAKIIHIRTFTISPRKKLNLNNRCIKKLTKQTQILINVLFLFHLNMTIQNREFLHIANV